MVLDKGKQLKIAVYLLVFILLGFGGYYYYQYLQSSSEALDVATEQIVTKKLIGKTLNDQVLQDRKFKDLRKIVVEEKYLNSTTTATSGLPATAEDVNSIARRYSNPFKPF